LAEVLGEMEFVFEASLFEVYPPNAFCPIEPKNLFELPCGELELDKFPKD
jgi:hypothetical protein